MRAPRPSRFAIVSLLVLMLLGVVVNLYIAHLDPYSLDSSMFSNTSFVTDSPSSSDPVRWPTIPDEVVDEMGTPTKWTYDTFNLCRYITIQSGDIVLMTNDGMSILEEYRFGIPLTARSTKRVYIERFRSLSMIWPTNSELPVDPAVTYHPLGLIINPIIYALPIWFVLMLIRYMLFGYKLRKRIAQGLCLQCAYDIKDMPICPECGTAVNPTPPTP